MSKNYLIRCDMEGVAGVVGYEQTNPAAAEYPLARQWFMAELVALIEGLQQGGAGRIVVYDMHYFGRNIDIAQLPQGTTALCGKPAYRADWAGGLDDSFDGLILHGLHAKAGTADALLAHSYEHDIADLLLDGRSVDGRSVGEIGMEAAIAGDYGVPTVMITGDSAGVAEAKELLPGLVAVSVKESLGESAAACLSLGESVQAIRRAADELVSQPPDVKPFCVGQEARLDVRLNSGSYLDSVRRLVESQMSDDFTLSLHGGNATELWAEYSQIKLRCQATF